MRDGATIAQTVNRLSGQNRGHAQDLSEKRVLVTCTTSGGQRPVTTELDKLSDWINMRMVKRKDCTYEQFEKMRQQILDTAPYGLINDIYDKKNRIAYLYFWDSDYIPKDWEQWVVRPVSKKSEQVGASEEHR